MGAESAEEVRRRAIGLVGGILQEAGRLGMETGLSIQPFQWPKEFMKVLPGSEMERQLGDLTAGPGVGQAMEDRGLREMVTTIFRAYVETYPDIDYIHVGMPEHRSWVGQAARAYRRLTARYPVPDLDSYNQLRRRARGRVSFPGGGERVETMLRGDLSSLWFFDSLLREKQLLKRPGGGEDIRIVYNGVVAELFPLVARMLPPGGEMLNFIDYTASRQLRQPELLRQVPPGEGPLHSHLHTGRRQRGGVASTGDRLPAPVDPTAPRERLGGLLHPLLDRRRSRPDRALSEPGQLGCRHDPGEGLCRPGPACLRAGGGGAGAQGLRPSSKKSPWAWISMAWVSGFRCRG